MLSPSMGKGKGWQGSCYLPGVFSKAAYDVAMNIKTALHSIAWPTVAALTNKKIVSFASSSADPDITWKKKAGHKGLFFLFLL